MTGSIYKQFAFARTAFCALAACLFLILAIPAHAQPNTTYTVEGVEVDVTAKNAVEAREKALGEAQAKAYQMLAERFLSPEELTTFQVPGPDILSNLVQDFEVTNEQLSAVRYKGVFTIRFRPTAMKSQMAAQGKTYSDVPQKSVLVLPFYQTGGRTSLWDDMNPWMRAWRNLPSDRGLTQPTVLPLGDAQDMAQLADEQALGYDPLQVQELATRYSADEIAVLLASPETTGRPEGRLAINIYSNGFEGPVFVQKVVVDQLNGEGSDALFARAAIKVKEILRSGWKANAAYNPMPGPLDAGNRLSEQTDGTFYQQPDVYRQPSPPVAYTPPALGSSTAYAVYARFASVQEWVRMKNTLDHVYGVQAVMIKSLKSREAFMDIRYAGSLQALQLALQNAGIIMRASPDGGIEIFMAAASRTIYGQ